MRRIHLFRNFAVGAVALALCWSVSSRELPHVETPAAAGGTVVEGVAMRRVAQYNAGHRNRTSSETAMTQKLAVPAIPNCVTP
ncbi:hypothetical protein ACC699_38295, partial [Rhizobium ruizarguesonis]